MPETTIPVKAKPVNLLARVPPWLHDQLLAFSVQSGISMNELQVFAVEEVLRRANVDPKAVISAVGFRKSERLKGI